jgi:hypothetical protein
LQLPTEEAEHECVIEEAARLARESAVLELRGSEISFIAERDSTDGPLNGEAEALRTELGIVRQPLARANSAGDVCSRQVELQTINTNLSNG